MSAYEDAMQQVRADQERRALECPTVEDCLQVAAGVYQRLKDLGWRDIVYCPKDGSWFDAIEFGSSGIHECMYMGEWPDGHWFVSDGGDLWPARPSLFKLKA